MTRAPDIRTAHQQWSLWGYHLRVGVTVGVFVGVPVRLGGLERERSRLWGRVGLEMSTRLDQFEEHDFNLLTLLTRINTWGSVGRTRIIAHIPLFETMTGQIFDCPPRDAAQEACIT